MPTGYLIPESEYSLGVHGERLGEVVVVVPLQDLHECLVEEPRAQQLLVLGVLHLLGARRVPHLK